MEAARLDLEKRAFVRSCYVVATEMGWNDWDGWMVQHKLGYKSERWAIYAVYVDMDSILESKLDFYR
jgi:hypothetical protein